MHLTETLEKLENELFSDFWFANAKSGIDSRQEQYPALFANFIEKDDCYDLQISLPGFYQENIEVKMKGDKLVAKAKHSQRWWNGRTASSYFFQSYSIPIDVSQKNIISNYNDGVLHIQMPKKNKKVIPIHAEQAKVVRNSWLEKIKTFFSNLRENLPGMWRALTPH